METLESRRQIEEVVDVLLAAGVFRTDGFKSQLTSYDLAEIAEERSNWPIVKTDDGWHVVCNKDSVAATTLRRIAGVLDEVPHDEASKAIIKLIEASSPGSGKYYEARPSNAALRALLGFLDCECGRDSADYSRMPDWIAPEGLEEELHKVLSKTIDGNLNASRLVRRLGITGKRTWFNDKFIPTVPFVLNEKGAPIRLLGFEPIPALHAQDEGCFIGIEVSECGTRSMIEYRVSEEAVESASFNISAAAKEIVAGEYEEAVCGVTLRFRLDVKNARKLSGVGRVIRTRFPDYVSGQNAYVILDKVSGKALVEVADAIDHEARARMRELLANGLEASPAPAM